MTKKTIVYAICAVLLTFSPVNAGPGEFQEEAAAKLPYKQVAYTHEELRPIFHPVLYPAIKTEFETYFSILFQEGFPPPKHPNEKIVKGYRCLYTKMVDAYTKNFQEGETLQREALHQLMALHKTPIGKINPDLAKAIKAFPCPSCMETARTELLGQESQ